jgi:hypothetical protein
VMNLGEFQSAYETELNSALYANWRTRKSEFWRSEQYFMTSEFFQENMSILDVGGASGGYGNALVTDVEPSLDYSCIDVDSQAIELGKIKYPHFNFICGSFPNSLSSESTFDHVVVNAWFSQVIEWKTFLLNLSKITSKFLQISLNFRLEGTTVVDPDLSYFYYLDSGIRVPELTHNIFEFLNFASIHEIGAKKITFYGYNSPQKKSSAFRPLPREKVIQGNLVIEKFPQQENEFLRIGGISNEASKVAPGFQTFRPQLEIIINDSALDLS